MNEVKIHVQADCGNSPRKAQIRDVTIAYAQGDSDQVIAQVADTIRWHLVGDKLSEGKPAFTETLKTMQGVQATELWIDHIITHGKSGAVNGRVHLADQRTFAFCDIVTFTSHGKNALIKTMTSYVIEVNDKTDIRPRPYVTREASA